MYSFFILTIFSFRVQAQEDQNYNQELEVKNSINEQIVQPVPQQTSSIEYSEDIEEEKTSDFNLSIDLKTGYSSNVAQFEGSPADSFVQVSPNLDFYKEFGDVVYLSFNGGGFYRKFNDELVNNNFRMGLYHGEGTISFMLGERFELGTKFLGINYIGREVDYQNSENEDGRDSKYYIVSGDAFLRLHGRLGYFQVAYRQEVMKALTSSIDENGNLFKNSNDTSSFIASFLLGDNENVEWDASYTFSNKEYTERRARFVNGSIDPNFQTPFLQEYSHNIKSYLGFYFINLDIGYQWIFDRVYGAETRRVGTVSLSTPFNLGSYISLNPQFLWSPVIYDDFIGNIINDSNAKKLRRDDIKSYALDLTLNLGIINPIFEYSHTQLTSNYTLLQYEEDLFMGGFRLQF